MSFLKLSRKVHEKIVVDESMTITVLSIEGNRVHLGFSAPKEIAIDREEIAARKRQELVFKKSCTFDNYFKRGFAYAKS